MVLSREPGPDCQSWWDQHYAVLREAVERQGGREGLFLQGCSSLWESVQRQRSGAMLQRNPGFPASMQEKQHTLCYSMGKTCSPWVAAANSPEQQLG